MCNGRTKNPDIVLEAAKIIRESEAIEPICCKDFHKNLTL